MSELSVYRTPQPIAALVLAHGAGAGQQSRFMVDAARGLAERGIVTATFDFDYIRMGRKVPDRAPALEATWRATVAAARTHPDMAGLPLFIGGKSMGGRIASHLAAAGEPGIAGLVMFGYPLHPPGKPETRRDAHLPSIRVPMLFIQGSRDAFGTPDEIRALLPSLDARTVLHEIRGGDHSFKVPAAMRPQADAFREVLDTAAAFMRRIAAG